MYTCTVCMYNCIVLDYEMAIQYSTCILYYCEWCSIINSTWNGYTIQYTVQYSTIQYNTVHVYYTTVSDAVLSIVLEMAIQYSTIQYMYTILLWVMQYYQ